MSMMSFLLFYLSGLILTFLAMLIICLCLGCLDRSHIKMCFLFALFSWGGMVVVVAGTVASLIGILTIQEEEED